MHNDDTSVRKIEIVGSEETLGQIIFRISRVVMIPLPLLFFTIFSSIICIVINSIVGVSDDVEVL